MTLKSVLTILLFSFSSLLFSQQSRLMCNGFKYEQYPSAWSEKTMQYKYNNYCGRCLNELHIKDTAIVNKILKQILNRAGKEFYNQLVLIDLIISRKPEKCNNIKFTFRYVFKIDTTFCYRISLNYDKEGNLVGDNAFPSISENPSFNRLLSVCNSIDSLVNDTSFTNFYKKFKNDFKFAIAKVLLDYDKESNNFVYKIYGITIAESSNFDSGFTGNWNGKLIIINAKTGIKIRTENYEETKYMNFR